MRPSPAKMLLVAAVLVLGLNAAPATRPLAIPATAPTIAVPIAEQLRCPYLAWTEEDRAAYFTNAALLRENPQADAALPAEVIARLNAATKVCGSRFGWRQDQFLAALQFANGTADLEASRAMLRTERLPLDLVETVVVQLSEAEKDSILSGQPNERVFQLLLKRISEARSDLLASGWPRARQTGRGVGRAALAQVANERIVARFGNAEQLAKFLTEREAVRARIRREQAARGN